MSDNRAMSPRTRRARRLVAITALRSAVLWTVATGPGIAAPPPVPGSLRELFPTASIDSTERADAALAATDGARARVEREFEESARSCATKILVNDCLDRARALQRARLGEIDGVRVDADRFKRRAKADRIAADRDKRESDRATNAEADAALRSTNRKAFDDKQERGVRDSAERTRSDAARAASSVPHRTANGARPMGSTDDPQKRAKNAADYAAKVQQARAHSAEIERRVAAKAADRKRRDDARKAKEARAATAATAQ